MLKKGDAFVACIRESAPVTQRCPNALSAHHASAGPVAMAASQPLWTEHGAEDDGGPRVHRGRRNGAARTGARPELDCYLKDSSGRLDDAGSKGIRSRRRSQYLFLSLRRYVLGGSQKRQPSGPVHPSSVGGVL